MMNARMNRTGTQFSFISSILVALAFFSPTAWSEQAPPTQPTTQAAVPTLVFRVIDKKTQKPIVGAKVTVGRSCQESDNLTTDAKGQAIVPITSMQYLSVSASKDGFVPKRVSWGEQELKKTLPKEYTMALEPGTVIGGIIQNEKGEPIEGATVFILIPTECNAKECVSIHDYPVKTDGQGKWRCDIIPAKVDDIWIRLSHPDYISDNMYGATQKPPMEKLRDMTGVMVMKKGFTVKGRVTDKAGKPIPNAQVAQGSDRWGSHYPETKTNAQGEFEFKNVNPDKFVLTVQASGYAPDLKEIAVDKNTKPVKFSLELGKTIKGRIVDTAGKPVSGAFVAADTWRGNRSIEWRVDTDAEGRFVWKDAPADEVLFDMGKQGYMSIRKKALTPSNEEHVLTMSPPLTIKGTVVDAKTGKPIDEFKLIPGTQWDPAQRYWEQRSAKPFTNGKYEFSASEPYPGHLIRIEAKGYKPAESRAIKSNEGSVVIDFKLEPAQWTTVTVLTPEGKPAVDADVAICTPSQHVMVQDGKFQRMQNFNVLTTDAEGRFTLPSQTEKYKLIILHDTGSAETSKSDTKVTLKSWGQVEGTVYIGSKPATQAMVALHRSEPYDPNSPRCYMGYTATSDQNGKFRFNRVFPGDWTATRGVRHGNMTSFTNGSRVTVKPGETSQVKIGGIGRPVVGRLVLPKDEKVEVNWSYGHYGISSRLPRPTAFEAMKTLGAEARKKWYENWKTSKEGQAYEREQRESKYYSFFVNSDGTFRAEDVSAGNYSLNASVHNPPVSGRCGYGEPIGRANKEFTIPPIPGGQSDQPFDLGSIELKLVKQVKLGTPAPEFQVKTLDGKTIKLSDYKGRYVLLDFWATWCGPCVGEMPALKEVYKKYGQDKRFVMLGLSLDNTLDDLEDYVKKNKISWPQGYLGEWAKTKVPESYHVEGVPAIFLIDPAGKIIEKDLRGPMVEQALEKHLGQPAKE